MLKRGGAAARARGESSVVGVGGGDISWGKSQRGRRAASGTSAGARAGAGAWQPARAARRQSGTGGGAARCAARARATRGRRRQRDRGRSGRSYRDTGPTTRDYLIFELFASSSTCATASGAAAWRVAQRRDPSALRVIWAKSERLIVALCSKSGFVGGLDAS
ncbi:hypothetical protein GOBAR_AA28146 [Gossypium barbadense]|uniref:Uncharacterized protein n=1 Tax=Gossypium barbadense TaxID=3634 RepID=A0A2P5WN80_GOSBA|nr:hypothetical protein GOBAR_AA28146 [Gossypium barbadense]